MTSDAIAPAKKPARRRPTDDDLGRGRRIAISRTNKELTQQQLADRLEVSAGLVGQWENGTTGLTAAFAARLEVELGVPMDWLLRGGDPKTERVAQTVTEQEQLDLVRAIPVERQEEFMAIVRAAAKAMTKT